MSDHWKVVFEFYAKLVKAALYLQARTQGGSTEPPISVVLN